MSLPSGGAVPAGGFRVQLQQQPALSNLWQRAAAMQTAATTAALNGATAGQLQAGAGIGASQAAAVPAPAAAGLAARPVQQLPSLPAAVQAQRPAGTPPPAPVAALQQKGTLPRSPLAGGHLMQLQAGRVMMLKPMGSPSPAANTSAAAAAAAAAAAPPVAAAAPVSVVVSGTGGQATGGQQPAVLNLQAAGVAAAAVHGVSGAGHAAPSKAANGTR
jgi:hypothetical protein